jgi:hypothetical protein
LLEEIIDLISLFGVMSYSLLAEKHLVIAVLDLFCFNLAVQHPLGLHLLVWLMECISSTYDNRCVSIAWVKLSAKFFIPLGKILFKV